MANNEGIIITDNIVTKKVNVRIGNAEKKNIEKVNNKGCNNIINLISIDSSNKLFLILTFENGGIDLGKCIPDMPHNEIFKQMTNAVNFCHKNGLIHADLKLDNFVHKNGIIKLIDFGNSIPESLIPTDEYEFISIINRPPELLLNIHSLGTFSDIWSLGCIFSQIIKGYNIFVTGEGITNGEIINNIAYYIGPSISPKYEEFLDCMIELPNWNTGLEKKLSDAIFQWDPHNRASAEEILELLNS